MYVVACSAKAPPTYSVSLRSGEAVTAWLAALWHGVRDYGGLCIPAWPNLMRQLYSHRSHVETDHTEVTVHGGVGVFGDKNTPRKSGGIYSRTASSGIFNRTTRGRL